MKGNVMTFKEQVKIDEDIFDNVTEYGRLGILDGVLMKVVVQTHNEARSGISSRNYEGLYGDFLDVYFKTSVYCKKRERLPKHGEYVMFWDETRRLNKRYEVLDARDEMGIAHLRLAAYRQVKLRNYQGVKNEYMD